MKHFVKISRTQTAFNQLAVSHRSTHTQTLGTLFHTLHKRKYGRQVELDSRRTVGIFSPGFNHGCLLFTGDTHVRARHETPSESNSSIAPRCILKTSSLTHPTRTSSTKLKRCSGVFGTQVDGQRVATLPLCFAIPSVHVRRLVRGKNRELHEATGSMTETGALPQKLRPSF